MKNSVKLMPYDKVWGAQFEQERDLLFSELADEITHVEHVGSTAIPHIKAKPIIDIAVNAHHFPPSKSNVQSLLKNGYQYRGKAGVEGRYWFTKGEPRKFNLHWCSASSKVVKAMTHFRDRLLANTTLAEQYEAIKVNSAPGQDIDSEEYAEAKSLFVEQVLNE